MSTTYLIKGVRVLGGEPTDLLLRDGVVAEVSGVSTGSTSGDVEVIEAHHRRAPPVPDASRPAQRSGASRNCGRSGCDA